jgi:hypothetical protein
MHYLHPAEGELLAHCPPPCAEEWQRFSRILQRKPMARRTLRVQLLSRGQMVGEFEGVCVAMKVNQR